MICFGDVVLVSENKPRIKWKELMIVKELIRGKVRKIRRACVLIKNKDSQGIIRRPINKLLYKLLNKLLYKLESLGSKATVQLKFIDKNEIKNVTSAK